MEQLSAEDRSRLEALGQFVDCEFALRALAHIDHLEGTLRRVGGWTGAPGAPDEPAAYIPSDLERLREWAERDGPLVSWGRIEGVLREAREAVR